MICQDFPVLYRRFAILEDAASAVVVVYVNHPSVFHTVHYDAVSLVYVAYLDIHSAARFVSGHAFVLAHVFLASAFQKEFVCPVHRLPICELALALFPSGELAFYVHVVAELDFGDVDWDSALALFHEVPHAVSAPVSGYAALAHWLNCSALDCVFLFPVFVPAVVSPALDPGIILPSPAHIYGLALYVSVPGFVLAVVLLVFVLLVAAVADAFVLPLISVFLVVLEDLLCGHRTLVQAFCIQDRSF